MNEERARRIGDNEALFRHVNDRIEDVNRAFSSLTAHMDIVCECGRASCTERIQVGTDDYERIRRNGDLFIALEGHEEPDVESVVERHGRWVVLEKEPGLPTALAEETDPRSE